MILPFFLCAAFLYLMTYQRSYAFIKKHSDLPIFSPLGSKHSFSEIFEMQGTLHGLYIQYKLYYVKNGSLPLYDSPDFHSMNDISKNDLIAFIVHHYAFLRLNTLMMIVSSLSIFTLIIYNFFF